MNSAPRTPQEDDVGRLFKQLDLDAFRFRSFDRSGGEGGDSDASEFQSSAAEPAAEGTTGPAPAAQTMVLPPVAPVALPPMVAARAVSSVDVAFSRLLRHSDDRSSRLPGFRLALPHPPRLVELPSTNGHELRISEVLNRLYRLGGSKMSLIRQRGDA